MVAKVDDDKENGQNRRFGRLADLYHRVAPRPHPVSISPCFVGVAAAVYGTLHFVAPTTFLPGGAPFAALLIWLSAVICADIAAWLRLPRVVGMLLGGLLLENVPNSPVAAFPPDWGSAMRAGGLATIYLRCGLVLEWHTMRQYHVPAIKLALVPGLVEMCFDAGLAVAVFGMPPLLAFTMGSLLQAVGPALLVPLLFTFQQQRLGTHEGVPQSGIVSASFDDIVAITWYSVFSCLAVTGQGNLGWQIARGPVQVLIGVFFGGVFGFILALTRVWDTPTKRMLASYFSCLFIMFLLDHFNMLSGGALGALSLGMVAAALWRAGAPAHPLLSLGPAGAFADELDAAVAQVFDWLAEPLIFGTIGAAINFRTLPAGVVGRAVLIVTTGLIVRCIATFLCMWGSGRPGDPPYTWRSRLFFAIAWTPKATVQAALSGAVLHSIRLLKADAPDFEQWLDWGRQIQATGVVCILICATLGTMATELLGPRLLDKAPNAEDEKELMAEVAAREELDALSHPRQSFAATPRSLVMQYMSLASVLKASLHGGTSGGGGGTGGGGTGGGAAQGASGGGGRASGDGAPGSAAAAAVAARRQLHRRVSGVGHFSTEEALQAMERIEGLLHERAHRQAISVRRALEIESVALDHTHAHAHSPAAAGAAGAGAGGFGGPAGLLQRARSALPSLPSGRRLGSGRSAGRPAATAEEP
ncbi:mitochondrial sodium hydrogen exchanger [Raphidocelis subcapitata]|uniref:Mitochondrial sodium hydrogen exchanger n=1 Tax=Raphidocelis subcapitata TaxID=307507 RepID=A0A2V0NNX2_9CHLO|nr:mitochondrial sodium hydrogen exchanger [Raphidocelis subcapitata]|eukprot:GBF89298.1 mitochondrial sodium hydrogen exchanger [Raphidocelis subcapitata]